MFFHFIAPVAPGKKCRTASPNSAALFVRSQLSVFTEIILPQDEDQRKPPGEMIMCNLLFERTRHTQTARIYKKNPPTGLVIQMKCTYNN